MKKKKFDCVQMKHEIQRKILKEWQGLSPAEQRRRTLAQIAADPILGRLWREARHLPLEAHPAKARRKSA